MRLLDRFLDLLMQPRVRRIRRWSSVVTLPVFLVLLYTGNLATGAAVVAVRVALFAAVVVAALRVKGERGEALRDLLMHPRARAFLRAELDVLLTLPRVALGRRGRSPASFRYDRGGGERLAMAGAFTPAILAEAVPLHLLLPPSWTVAHVASAALHAYALLWLWGWALGPRAWPHAVRGATLVVRGGALHRLCVPLDAIRLVTVERRTHRGDGQVRVDGTTALLPARNRTDVVLELNAPVRFERPLAEPATVTRVELASDDPEAFARELERAALGASDRAEAAAILGPLAVVELARG
jgi:hypothetical protein